MEQQYKILLNKRFSATTEDVNANIQYVDNYYINPQGESDKVVDQTNIRSFLSSENNQIVVKGFVGFMTANTIVNETYLSSGGIVFTPTAEFKNIYYDDEKLAEVFNNYYNTTVLRGIQTSQDVLNNQSQNVDGGGYKYETKTVVNNNFFWEDLNNRINTTEDDVIKTSTDENYFITVSLVKNFNPLSRNTFELCNDSIKKNMNNGNALFSQDNSNIAKYDDFFSNLTSNKNSINYAEILSGPDFKSVGGEMGRVGGAGDIGNINSITPNQVVQCFVDLNIKTNENEVWK